MALREDVMSVKHSGHHFFTVGTVISYQNTGSYTKKLIKQTALCTNTPYSLICKMFHEA